MKHATKLLWACLLLLFLALSLGSGGATAGDSLESQVLLLVAQEQNLPVERLEVVALDPLRLPLTGVTLFQAKVIDRETGQVYGLAVDPAGQSQDATAARQDEQDAHTAQYGNLEPALYDLLQGKLDDDQVTVGVWLKGDIQPLERPQAEPISPEGDVQAPAIASEAEKTPELLAALQEQRVEAIKAAQAGQRAAIASYKALNREAIAAQVSALESPFLEEMAALGYPPVYASPYAPLIYFDLPKREILALSTHPAISVIYGPTNSQDAMDSAKPTQKGTVVDSTWGFEGDGINVAIIEDSRIEFGNPYLNDGTTRVPGDGNVDDHATGCAGIVASQHGTYEGIAQGVNLFSANATTYSDANLTAAIDWAVSQNADILNNSWGSPDGTGLNVHDRHLDNVVLNYWDNVMVAAGNDAGTCGGRTGKVGSPGRGYNVLTVGNFEDHGSLTWTGDTMDSCSSYVDPASGLDKPEIAAVGADINSTTASSPWVGNIGSGTSYASPMVSGSAALLLERSSNLTSYPEAVKAILMATGLHNIEGASRFSDYDGAGGMDIRAAFHLADMGWWGANYIEPGSTFPMDYTFTADAGEVIRLAIAWDSYLPGDYSSDSLEADLDLHLLDPSGYVVADSSDWSNSFEVVEHTATASGTYTLRVHKYSYPAGSHGTYVGAAWWVSHRFPGAYTPITLAEPPVSRQHIRGSALSYWNALGIRPAGTADYDIQIYGHSAFGDPADYNNLGGSSSGASPDYVLIDGNHAGGGDYFLEVRKYSGTGGFYAEWATHSADTRSADGPEHAGTHGPYTMAPSQVLRVWDTYLNTNVPKYFAVRPTSGDADLGMALYQSDPADWYTWYRGRSSFVALADSNGAGAAETFNYMTTGANDWLGLVVYSKGASANTTFYLYTDTSAPTGSISINGGATYANNTSVTLDLSGVDADTGVYQMRFSNNGTTYTAWEAYATSKVWPLASGDGTKTVYVEFKNNAEMTSATYSDSIILDMTAPTGSIVVNGGAAYTNNANVTLALSASDANGIADMRLGNYGSTWGAWEPYATSKSWTLISGDGTKSVYVQYRDNAGNVYETNDSIILDTTAPTGSISINGGAAATNSPAATLNLSASDGSGSGVAEMHFSNNGSTYTAWEPYAALKAWTLSPGDGNKTVYVEFRDNAGNISSSYNDSIIVDTTLPTGSIVVNAGAAYTNNVGVTLSLSASDGSGSGVAEMHFSNNGSTFTAWEPYSATKAWTLTSGDGAKTVYVQYRDNAGNISTSYSDGITLDTTAPTGSISINGGAAYATGPSVSLNLSASDGGGAGVAEMSFSNDGSTWSAWEPYATSKAWTLSAGDGSKTVWVRFRDPLDNVSGSYSDGIILDTTAPTGSVVANSGAAYTNSTGASLGLSAADANGVAEMRFSNDGATFSAWEPYATTKTWTLAGGDGVKTVYVQYRDSAGNASGSFGDDIVLDTTAPVTTIGSPATTTHLSFTVQWSGTDSGSGVESYWIEYRVGAGAWQAWLSGIIYTSATFGPTDPVSVAAGQTYEFRVRALDRAGNASIWATSSTAVTEAMMLFMPVVVR